MHATAPPPRVPWTTLVLLALAQFMVVLDITVVNVALPAIGETLRFGAADLAWVITAYVLVTGGLMLLGGRAGDRLGHRPVLLAGLVLFTAASLLSGVAWSPAALIASRAAQGLGAALLMPAALAIVTTTYSGGQRAIALGAWGAIGSAGAAVGVLLGGVLVTLLSWRWIFLVNVPVGIVVGAGVLRLVEPARPPRAAGRLDLAGAAAVMAGVGALAFALQQSATWGWGSISTLATLGAAGVLLALFATVERASADPLVPPATWRVRSLVSGAATMLGTTGVLVGAFLLNSLFLQEVLGASALETGLAFLPLALAILAGAHATAHLLPRLGGRMVLLAGLMLSAAGCLLLARAPQDARYLVDLLPGFVAIGAGAGLSLPALSVTAMAKVRHEDAGLAAGLLMTAHEVGAALGVAVLSAVSVAAAGGHDAAARTAGYHAGFLAAAGIAAALAVLALVAVPQVRPEPGARVGVH